VKNRILNKGNKADSTGIKTWKAGGRATESFASLEFLWD